MRGQQAGLLMVDVQNDFCPGGAFGVPGGDRVVPVLNRYIERFADAGLPLYASRDWHPPETRHFSQFGGSWPVHCVQSTEGAAFHSELRLPRETVILTKGTDPNEDAYSVFQAETADGIPFQRRLEQDRVTHLYVGGLATDYCVRASVLDALAAGLAVTLLVDAIAGVEVNPGDSERAIAEMQAAGAAMATINDVAPGI